MRLLPVTPDDEAFLWEMLAFAAAPLTARPLNDHDRLYLDGWGAAHDRGLVAWDDGRRLGAAWGRRLPEDRPGYGWVDATTPELAIAAVPEARGRGVGRALLAGWLDLEAAHGTPQVSLSVNLANERAVAVYRSLGFEEVEVRESAMTMVAPTAPAPPADDDPARARLASQADGPAIARLRRVMFEGFDDPPRAVDWIDPLLAMWPEEVDAGRWVGAVVDGPDGRPVASALAALHPSPPGPGRPHGHVAQVGSVATEPAWRRRGAARAVVALLLDALDRRGVESSTLNASPAGAGLYEELGYRPAHGQAMRRPRP